jgi:hypothetical protein
MLMATYIVMAAAYHMTLCVAIMNVISMTAVALRHALLVPFALVVLHAVFSLYAEASGKRLIPWLPYEKLSGFYSGGEPLVSLSTLRVGLGSWGFDDSSRAPL